jgi:UDP-glucose 4-epimerase
MNSVSKNKKTALVTGVAGFLGSHIADNLISDGWDVVGIDNLIGGYTDNVPKGVNFFQKDLADLSSIEDHFKGVDIVIHSACTAYEGLSVFSPALVVQNTVQITATVLSASVKAGVSKVIYLSSMARYGTQDSVPFLESMTPMPQDPYGIAKVCAENLVKNICSTHGLQFAILVPHNIIGPRQKYDDPFRNVASIMVNRMLRGEQPIIYGDGEQKRCFSFMTDVVNPIMRAVKTDAVNGMVVNIGPDEEFISINQLGRKLADIIGFEFDPIYVPGRPQEVVHANCSAEKSRQLLGYETTVTLDEGLRELVEWIKSRGTRPFEYHLPLEFVTDSTPRTWTEQLI